MSEYDRLSKPHDRLFKKTLGIDIYMGEFLETALPEELSERFDFCTLTGKKDSYIDEEIKEYLTDLMFEVKLKDSENAGYVYCLFEHKSYEEKWTALKLLNYMVRIWYDDIEENDELPLILPIVFYHGEGSWSAPASLNELVGPGLEKDDLFFPDYEFILLDMDELVYSIENFSHPRLRLYLRAVDVVRAMDKPKEVFDKAFFAYLDELADPYWDDTWEFDNFAAFTYRYVLDQAPEEKEDDIITGAKNISSKRSDKLMSVADKLRREGKKEEALEAVVTFLEKKFDTELSIKLKNELKEASYETLKELQLKVFDIESESDVFEIMEKQ